ncbi:MAG TPA: ATP-binding cassette domain-containing protein [Burkholderiales bacterium]|nr:ATP-binding cassette domain-containing protein [Burkholderiales bacterium]
MIALENVSKAYNARVAVHALTLELKPRRTSVLIGPSGCGKSTLLRMMVGLVRPDTGSVSIGGVVLTPETVERARHGIGYVIQDGGLFPHLSARENVTLLARYLRKPRHEIEERVAYLIELAGLSPDALSRYPQQLSGGQRQRVGLMRALMLDPPVLLLDEPLGALDPVTRHELQTELASIFDRLRKTVVLVTHDMGEAAFFADEIVMLRDGRVVQRGSTEDFLERPADDYVSTFVRAQRMLKPAARS